MSGLYLRVFERIPAALKRRIHPLEFGIQDLVKEAAAQPSRSIVIDAGAGECRFAKDFHQHCYVGVDFARGEEAWDYSQLNLVGDLKALPIRSGCADVALSTQVLEHVPNPDQVIQEIGRILRPGGRLYLSAPQGWGEHQQPYDFYRFTRFSLQQLLHQAGFTGLDIRPMGGYFHYLGHRLTYIPKILFSPRRGIARLLLLPLEIACLAFFCLIAPIACYYLDRLDSQKEFTLGYRVVAIKS